MVWRISKLACANLWKDSTLPPQGNGRQRGIRAGLPSPPATVHPNESLAALLPTTWGPLRGDIRVGGPTAVYPEPGAVPAPASRNPDKLPGRSGRNRFGHRRGRGFGSDQLRLRGRGSRSGLHLARCLLVGHRFCDARRTAVGQHHRTRQKDDELNSIHE